jgi:hypothetical protein
MKIRSKIESLADRLQKITQQKFVAIREGDHEQAKTLQSVQIELDAKIHDLEKKLVASQPCLVA